jgi:2,4-dienoyl-CoA reductase-like NADH-dependent reductase (Old Yellow Enzyme family)
MQRSNMAGQYHYLFTPIRIGQTIIPNRVVFAAHLTAEWQRRLDRGCSLKAEGGR